jgi:FkbM family methyltransferase
MTGEIEAQLSGLKVLVDKQARDQKRLLHKLNDLELNQKLLLRKLNDLLNFNSCYIGEKKVITQIRTGQWMIVDGRDRGSGLSLTEFGYTEPNVMKVLQRAFRPGAVFLDVGANFGFYTVFAGGQVGSKGRVYAFEANHNLMEFIEDNVRMNGLEDRVTIINKAVSDHKGTARFGFSFAGIGGGSLQQGANWQEGSKNEYIDVPLARIDDTLPSDLVVDCAKLDVEGNELATLRGMRSVISRSPNIQIAIEFFPALLHAAGGGALVLDFLDEMGLRYWMIGNRGQLKWLERESLLRAGPCYILAAREQPNDQAIVLGLETLVVSATTDAAGFLEGPTGAILVHGPLWSLQRGPYRVTVEGDIEGSLNVAFAHEFGFVVASKVIGSEDRSLLVNLNEDVRYFEIIIRSTGPNSRLKLDRILIEER